MITLPGKNDAASVGKPAKWILFEGGPILVMLLIMAGLYIISLESYLLFHSLVEIITIVIGSSIFLLAWNSRGFLEHSFLIIIGAAFLFDTILVVLHTLTYEGMNVIPIDNPNIATQFWVASQYLLSFSFLAAALSIKRKPVLSWTMASYITVTFLLVCSIIWWHIFPDSYLPGIGLTPFKRVSEGMVSIILLASIILLWQKRKEFDPHVFRMLVLTLALNIIAEGFFSIYQSVFSLANLLGHYFHLLSYWVIYKAIVQVGFEKPYDLLFRELKTHEKALWQKTLELELRNEDLDAFAHSVAHDLKNPISAMVITTNALAIPEIFGAERQNLSRNLVDTAYKMNSIIDNLLLFAEVRECDVPREPMDMAAIVHRAVERLATLIEENQAEIILPINWPAALGNSHWLEEVWVNYLSNALKYGGKQPRIEFGADEQPDGYVRYWLQDNGPGLSKEEQSRLFKPFTRLSQRSATGHGLGLSIVRRIVEKLGGQVGVESEVGRGSRFYFTLARAA